MKSTWILVAESSRARIFGLESTSGPLVEIATLAHPEGREHEQHMTRDLPGHDRDKTGAGRHAFGDETEPKEQEVINFAKRIAKHLEAARTRGHLTQLVIIAAPSFLGTLRGELTQQTSKLVIQEMDKNLSKHSAAEIRAHLPEFIRG